MSDLKKILVVDDEQSIRSLLKYLLEMNGYACNSVSDTREAKLIMRDKSFDVVLCDIQMPGESGLELARHVTSEYPDTAVIMVTVIEDRETAKTVLDMGVYGYILKPFDENQILISLANALRRRELEIKERSYRQDLERTVQERTTRILKMNKDLIRSEAELKSQKEELEEVKSALRVLLKKRVEDKAALEENILINVKKTVEPLLEKLTGSSLNPEQREILHILASHIREMTSPFVKELSSAFLDLTPTEIQVAGLIKLGKTTKDIANLLNLSQNTIMSHRYKIRSKLGLLKKKTNLHSFLHTLH